MTSEVVAEIEAQVRQMRANGQVPPELEGDLDKCFEEVAEASLFGAASLRDGDFGPDASHPTSGLADRPSFAQLRRQATAAARRQLGPSLRRLERRASLAAARLGEVASIRVHVTVDHLERLATSSQRASRVLAAARPGGSAASVAGALHPLVEGPLLAWVIERLSAAPKGTRDPARVVLHAECGDGRVVAALAARGFNVRGVDPHAPVRSDGDTRIVAAGALEFLGATQGGTLDGLVLTGVVDCLRPGEGRVLAQLAARCLAPGGVVVLVSARPEAVVALDPVAADLAHRRPLHPVTWCHLLARYGLSVLEVFEPEASEPDVFAVSAQRPTSALLAGEGSA
jgi:SAM-dependent methyltransferase